MLYSGQLKRGSYTQRLTVWLPTLLKYGDVSFLSLQRFQPCHLDSCSNLINRPFSLFSCSVMSKSLQPRGLQHARPPCPSPTPRVYSNSCPLNQWCLLTISSSVIFFSSCLQSFPESGSFPVSPFLASGGQSIGASASASVFPLNIQGWFPLGWTGWISLKSKGLSRVFSSTTTCRHHFFGAQPFLLSKLRICTWLLEKTIALTIWTFVGKVKSLLFNILPRFVKEQVSFNFNFMAAVTVHSDFGAQENIRPY